jgi:hypothetical protein
MDVSIIYANHLGVKTISDGNLLKRAVSFGIITKNEERNLTAETPRTQRSDFSFGGERPPNENLLVYWKILSVRSYGHEVQSEFIPEG